MINMSPILFMVFSKHFVSTIVKSCPFFMSVFMWYLVITAPTAKSHKITNERRNSLFISDVKYKCAKKPCFSSLSFVILCYLSLLFLMFVFLSGASNTVTGETKSFFSFAKSVSQCCRPQTTACNRNSTRHTGVTQDPRVSSSFFFFSFLLPSSGGRWRRWTPLNCMKRTKS